jgi:ABC-type siderophore export system fused ATPase/permease subunit
VKRVRKQARAASYQRNQQLDQRDQEHTGGRDLYGAQAGSIAIEVGVDASMLMLMSAVFVCVLVIPMVVVCMRMLSVLMAVIVIVRVLCALMSM